MLRTSLLCPIAVFLFCSVNANAGGISSLSAPCSQLGLHSLQDYLNLDGRECSVGILNFDSFGYTIGGTSTSPYSASQIALAPSYNRSDGATGFTFSLLSGGQFSVAAGFSATYEIDYQYVIDAGPIGMAADIGMDPPFGNVSISQSICADSFFFGANQCVVPSSSTNEGFQQVVPGPQTLSVDNTNPPFSWSAHLALSPQVMSFADVHNLINLDGTHPGTGDNGFRGAGFDNVIVSNSIVNSSPTPEPASALLLLGGGLALGALRKRIVG
jgi:hypothetical protein